MPSKEELERQAFEAWFKRDFHPDKTGPYVKHQLYFAWLARAKQESNYSFDEKALDSARKIMALVYGKMPPGGSVQLQAQIQVEIIAAMQWAAPERK